MEGSGESAFRRPAARAVRSGFPSMRLGEEGKHWFPTTVTFSRSQESSGMCALELKVHGFAFNPLWKILQVGDWVMLPEASKHYRRHLALGVSSLSLVESTNLLVPAVRQFGKFLAWRHLDSTWENLPEGQCDCKRASNSQMPTGLRGIISSYWEAQILYIADAAITWGTSGNSSQHPMGERINSRNLLW